MKIQPQHPSLQSKAIRFSPQPKGIALIIVMSCLAIITMMAVAILSISRREGRSAGKISDYDRAGILAESAISMVMGQIWEGTQQDSTGGREIWASQPGAIRKYNNDGTFHSARKLYSDDQMTVKGNEKSLNEDGPEAQWQQLPGKYVDLNEPVIQPDSLNDKDQDPELHFPILDPRAYVATEREKSGVNMGYNRPDSLNVEGFWYDETGKGMQGVVAASSATDVNARLPMPVQWLYMLQDGTTGHMEEQGVGADVNYRFISHSGVQATESNPIVGRVAYWTDDESCKVNINTASEPTNWQIPTLMHSRDQDWAVYQPSRFEFQRYPGHPATTALSSVLYPNADMDQYGKTQAIKDRIVALKEKIYEISPKVSFGGSKGGTIPNYILSNASLMKAAGAEKRVDLVDAINERLYASVDELLFSESINENQRVLNEKDGQELSIFGLNTHQYIQNGNTNFSFNKELGISRAKGFLTTASSAPEINFFGTPKIAMWPVIDSAAANAQQKKTLFDQAIAETSTLGDVTGNNTYYFKRASAYETTDAQISRNVNLFNYLGQLMAKKMMYGASIEQKIGLNNVNQMIVQIFDYVRSTNVYDSSLAKSFDDMKADTNYNFLANNATWFVKETHVKKIELRKKQNTFTDSRAYFVKNLADDDDDIANYSFPGNGQVMPTITSIRGQEVKGFGRFPVLSEVGFHLICNADGTPDPTSYRLPTFQVGKEAKDFPLVSNCVSGAFSAESSDGTNDIQPLLINYSKLNDFSHYNPLHPACHTSGGRTALLINNVDANQLVMCENDNLHAARYKKYSSAYNKFPAVWFSGYCPLSKAKTTPGFYGTTTQVPEVANWAIHPKNIDNHPGYDPNNWNYAIESDTPLLPGQKMVQMNLALEFTNISPGFNGLTPEFCLKVVGLKDLELNEHSDFSSPANAGAVKPYDLIPTTALDNGNDYEFIWRATGYETSKIRTSTNGGSFNTRDMTLGRFCGGRRPLGPTGIQLPNDIGFSFPGGDTIRKAGGYQTNGDDILKVRNYNFHSNYVRISSPVLSIKSNLIIKVYAGLNPNDESKLVQTYLVNFQDSKQERIPAPQLAVVSANTGAYAPSSWSFNADGVLERNQKNYKPLNTNVKDYLCIGRAGRAFKSPKSFAERTARLPNAIDWIFGFMGELNNKEPSKLIDYGVINLLNVAKAMLPNNPKEALIGNFTNVKPNFWSNKNGSNSGPVLPNVIKDLNIGHITLYSRPPFGQDTVVSKVPIHGDLRLLAVQRVVNADHWMRHPRWNATDDNPQYLAHSFFNQNNFEVIASRTQRLRHELTDEDKKNSLVPFIDYGIRGHSETFHLAIKQPDFCYMDVNRISGQGNGIPNFSQAKNYGDFDHGTGKLGSGSWINFPDEGSIGVSEVNLGSSDNPKWRRVSVAYLDYTSLATFSGEELMSPNRMVPSPVILGSLPTNTQGNPSSLMPFRTLLFRPHTQPPLGQLNHPGSASYFGGNQIADHQILDLFYMPIIDPYPITKDLQTKGKINLNYQIIPFNKYITRSTGLHALMKNEIFSAVPNGDAATCKTNQETDFLTTDKNDLFIDDTYKQVVSISKKTDDPIYANKTNSSDKFRYWHRKIDVERRVGNQVRGTLQQFENRFNFVNDNEAPTPKETMGLFRTASQICEIHLIPKKVQGGTPTPLTNSAGSAPIMLGDGSDPSPATPYTVADMGGFWRSRAVTGENLRERPYSNIYPRVTTQSNAYKVHYRVQMIRKSRSTSPEVFNPQKDQVTVDYRGFATLERYINQRDNNIPDYAANPGMIDSNPLDNFYRMRVIENKRLHQ